MDFGREKIKYFQNKTQFILLNLDGTIHGSCDTLIPVSIQKHSLYKIEPFLESIEDILKNLSLNEEVSFPCIGQDLLGKKGYFDTKFKNIDDNGKKYIQWIIIDLTEYYNHLIPIQQERNELDIKGEFREIKQKAISLEKELLEYQNGELKRQRRFKEEFFAQVSHEMRTPLNSIAGITDLLLANGGNLTSESKKGEYLKNLKDTTNHLTAIVSDILDLSKIEAGKIELESQVFNLSETIKSICNSFNYSVSNKNLSFNSTIDSQIPPYLHGDRQKLTQILFNVLGNAVKYTEKGSVGLDVAVLHKNDDTLKIQFTIADTGLGMDEEELKKVFEPYSRTSQVRDMMHEGTGLGMSIVHKFIEAMGGEISISSTIGRGDCGQIHLRF